MNESAATILSKEQIVQTFSRQDANAVEQDAGPAGLIGKAVATRLTERSRVKMVVMPPAPAEVESSAGAQTSVWFGAGELRAPFRVGMSLSALDRVVTIVCGGSVSSGAQEEERTIGYVGQAIFKLLVQFVADAIASELSEQTGRTAPIEYFSDVICQAFEERSPEKMTDWLIDFRTDFGNFEMVVRLPNAGLGAATQSAESAVDEEWSSQVSENVDRTEISLSAILEDRSITLAQIAACKVGSVLTLEATPDAIVKLYTGDLAMFDCRLGQASGHYTVQVAQLRGQASER